MNLFTIPPRADEEFIETLVSSREVRVERIVSQGHCSPKGFWYDQPEAELVFLLSGNALLAFENCYVILTAGDSLFIPAHLKHRVEQTDTNNPCVWLCLFGEFEKNKENPS